MTGVHTNCTWRHKTDKPPVTDAKFISYEATECKTTLTEHEHKLEYWILKCMNNY